MPSETLTHAREQHRRVLSELEEREWVLTSELVDEVHKHLEMAHSTLTLTHKLVKEIPGQPSLDYSGTKREVLKELEEMERRTRVLCDMVAKLRRTTA